MLKALLPAITICALGATAASATTAGTFTGKLWLTAVGNLNATLPDPTATPDATFSVDHISFFNSTPTPYVTAAIGLNDTITGFLSSASPVIGLKLSTIKNSLLGKAPTAATLVTNASTTSCGTYGPYMELVGPVKLTKNEYFTVAGVTSISLKIDGTAISPVKGGPNSSTPFLYGFLFTGATGTHTIDLAYADYCGDGFLSFSPAT